MTVLICTRDRLAFLKRTLASVYAQTFTDFEVVVCDDGSTDGTSAWLARRAFARLRVVRRRSPGGPAAARNAALAAARGRFVALLDSDDLWEPGYLAAQTARLATPGVVALLVEYQTIDARGRARPEWRRPPPVPRPLFARLTGSDHMPPPSTLAVRRSALRAIGGFDERFVAFADDTDLFLRLGRRYGRRAIARSGEVLARYRRHEAQASTGMRALHGELPPPARRAAAGALVIDLILYARKHGL